MPIDELYDGLSELSLYEMTETPAVFYDRRNRFLDHLLARFSENFSEYALLLYSYKEQQAVEAETLIRTKTSFLKQFPYQSAHKAQSFDYTNKNHIGIRKDQSGLHHRISTLLGIQPSLNYFAYDIVKENDIFSTELFLKDESGTILLAVKNPETTSGLFRGDDRDALIQQINFAIACMQQLVFNPVNYKVVADGSKFKIELGTPVLGYTTALYDTNMAATDAINVMVTFAKEKLKDERFMIIEHILLRPRKTGDALLDVCIDADCKFCGNEDPYSYQLSFVFDGESELPKKHFAFRRFAEKTIRAELPAHVLCKICWVKTEVYNSFEKAYTDWLTDTYVAPPVTDVCKTKAGVNANPLKNLICEFKNLKSIYPPATLHDCIDGNDDNRVFLNQTSL